MSAQLVATRRGKDESMMRTSDAVVVIGGQFGKNLACLSTKLAASANRRFEIHK
jgi:hypothetical protein